MTKNILKNIKHMQVIALCSFVSRGWLTFIPLVIPCYLLEFIIKILFRHISNIEYYYSIIFYSFF